MHPWLPLPQQPWQPQMECNQSWRQRHTPPPFLGGRQRRVATTEKIPKHDWCANHYGDEHEHSYSSTNRNRNPEQTIKCIIHQ